jgi:AAA family ATP:ADP antiporter
MFANVFLILCAYYFIKPLREGWIAVSPIAGLEKMEVKAYTSFGQSLVLVGVIAWYSQLVNRWPREKVIRWATLFCMSNMIIFWFVQPGVFLEHLPFSGIIFYIWVGMFGVFVVAQFWAFAADVYTDEVGRRLMPLIAVGATAGAAFGAQIVEFLVGGSLARLFDTLGLTALGGLTRDMFRAETLLLLALVPLGISILLTRIVDQRLRGATGPTSQAPDEGSRAGGISLVLGSRFLLAVAIVTVLLNWVNTNGENLLFRVVQNALEVQAVEQGIEGGEALLTFTRDGTTAFYGNFFSWVNIVALLLQALVASRLLKYGGFGAVLLLLPVVALTSYAAMALVPLLWVVKTMKIAENATDYSINNTARHVLWLPVPSAVKLKGKTTIDSLFARFGDGLAAVTILVGVQVLALATAAFFIFNVALILVWLVLCVGIVRRHRELAEGTAGPATASAQAQ